MLLTIDCEFNGFQGPLISMGIVSQDGKEFYEVVDIPARHLCNTWVYENVLPVIGDDMLPITRSSFRSKLQSYLNQWKVVHLVADWPEDFAHFWNEVIITGGEMITMPNISTQLYRGPKFIAEVPHNALSDARALMKSIT